MLYPDTNNSHEDENPSYQNRYDDRPYYPSASPSARQANVSGSTNPYQPVPMSPEPGSSFQSGPTLYNSAPYPAPSRPLASDRSGLSTRSAYGDLPPGTPGKRPRSGGGWRAGAITALTLVIAVVFGVGLFAGWQFGHTSTAVTPYAPGQLQQPSSSQAHVAIPALSGNNTQAVREAVVANVRPAIVQINVTTAQGMAIGSGVIIDKRGYIVTNNHVVAGAQTIDEVVLSDGTRVRNAQVVGVDAADDLAVIKINPPANMVVAPIGDSSQLQVGQEVLAIGNPLGNTQTVTSGIVSALGRNICEQQSTQTGGCTGAIIPNAIQTDAPINPGNSGGALVDLNGHLIGIPTLTAIDPEFNAPANGVGFAIPSNRVQFIVPQIIQNGKVTHTGRAAMGIYPTTVDQMTQAQDNLSVNHGILVTKVVNNGAAAKAGLQAGDVIVQIDNKAIDTIPSLEDALISKNPGDKVTVNAYRANQQLTFTVTLGELAAGQN